MPADDLAMSRAVERARAEVATFIGRLEKPLPGDRGFAVKAAIMDAGETEHFWLVDVRQRDGQFVGTIGNDPESVKNVKLGDAWHVAANQISDWMFVHDDRLVGGYSIRVIMDRLSPDERKVMVAGLNFKIE
jgi:uncharacterized protein YegJ (DUF2314 family)